MNRVLLLMGAGVLCTNWACTSDCTSMGCIPTLAIHLSDPVGGPGDYEIVAEHDGRVERCSYGADGQLPLPGSGLTCGELRISFDAAGALSSIQGPKIDALTLTLRRDGVVLVSETLRPAYEDQELNGPGCGTCPFASEELDTSSVDESG